MKPNTPIYIIIVAAGSGSRYGSALPKQFCQLCGRPVLMTTIERCLQAFPQAKFLLVLSREMTDFWYEQCESYGFKSPEIVDGGDTRWQSVKNALDKIYPPGIVLVHDGARPLVEADVVKRLIDRLEYGDVAGAVPVVPVTDSLRMLLPDGTSQAVNRSEYYAVQTPQCFDLTALKRAYSADYDSRMTDDASVIELTNNGCIATVDGSTNTLKITNPGDIAIVESILAHGKA